MQKSCKKDVSLFVMISPHRYTVAEVISETEIQI